MREGEARALECECVRVSHLSEDGVHGPQRALEQRRRDALKDGAVDGEAARVAKALGQSQLSRARVALLGRKLWLGAGLGFGQGWGSVRVGGRGSNRSSAEAVSRSSKRPEQSDS